jgi:hypothetical protein
MRKKSTPPEKTGKLIQTGVIVRKVPAEIVIKPIQLRTTMPAVQIANRVPRGMKIRPAVQIGEADRTKYISN